MFLDRSWTSSPVIRMDIPHPGLDGIFLILSTISVLINFYIIAVSMRELLFRAFKCWNTRENSNGLLLLQIFEILIFYRFSLFFWFRLLPFLFLLMIVIKRYHLVSFNYFI